MHYVFTLYFLLKGFNYNDSNNNNNNNNYNNSNTKNENNTNNKIICNFILTDKLACTMN